MSHTPGPWYSMKEGAIVPLKSIYCERLGFQIGFVNTDRKSIDIEAHDNANLIASAPDLLAALRDCVLELEAVLRSIDANSVHFDGDAFHERLTFARAAIAKATGEKA